MDENKYISLILITFLIFLTGVGTCNYISRKVENNTASAIVKYEEFQLIYNTCEKLNSDLCNIRSLDSKDVMFEQFSKQHYGQELADIHHKRTEESNKIWDEIRKNNSENVTLELYHSNKDIVYSKAWFKENTNSYQTIDALGFDTLTNGFIIGVIDRNKTEELLHLHLTTIS